MTSKVGGRYQRNSQVETQGRPILSKGFEMLRSSSDAEELMRLKISRSNGSSMLRVPMSKPVTPS